MEQIQIPRIKNENVIELCIWKSISKNPQSVKDMSSSKVAYRSCENCSGTKYSADKLNCQTFYLE